MQKLIKEKILNNKNCRNIKDFLELVRIIKEWNCLFYNKTIYLYLKTHSRV